MFTNHRKLKIFALAILSFLIFLISIIIVNFPNQRERYLNSVENITPDPYKACMTDYVDKNWDSIMQKYDKDFTEGRIRAARLEGDVVKHIVNEYLIVCETGKQ